MIKPSTAGFFDEIIFNNRFLRVLEKFCAFPRLGGKIYLSGGSLFRESVAAVNEERAKGKTVEVVKAIFMILFLPVPIIAYSARQIARYSISNRKNSEAEISQNTGLDKTELHYGRSILTDAERADFKREHLERIIAQTPELPVDRDLLLEIMNSEYAGWHTEILPGLVVGGITCDMGINYGYPKYPKNHFSKTEKNMLDTPLFTPTIGEKFDARSATEGIFDVLVSTNADWETIKLKGKTAVEIYLKKDGEHILGVIDSKLFENEGTSHLVGAAQRAVDAWKKGKKVSVQCAQGMDRSVTFIICMLYHMTKIDVPILVDFVHRKRALSNTFQDNNTVPTQSNFINALKAFS